jgi:hypothetical protein
MQELPGGGGRWSRVHPLTFIDTGARPWGKAKSKALKPPTRLGVFQVWRPDLIGVCTSCATQEV